MGAPRSSATISFPARFIDADIEKELDNPGVDIETEDGIFTMDDGDVAYGEFCDLEDLLVKKEVPFDRRSRMDWNRPPVLRVFRPGPPIVDLYIDLEADGDEPVVSVVKIREFLSQPRAADGIEQYLDEYFPAYPPLADFVTKG